MANNRVTIDIEARLIDNVSRDTARVRRQLDQMDRRRVRPRVELEESRFTRSMNRVNRLLDRLRNTRASVILDAMDRATSKIRNVLNRLKEYAKDKWQAVLSLRDQGVTTLLRNTMNKLREYGRKTWTATLRVKDMATGTIQGITNKLFNLKTLAAGIFAGMAAQKFVMEPVNLADTIESAKIAFETKLGSAEAAQRQLEAIYKFDEKSPFNTIEIVGITQQMMNMGWTAKQVLPDLEVIGDWAASMGKGEEGIQRVTLALGQMRQKGKLSSEEMLQLTEAGVSGWDYLASSLGKTIPEVRKMAEDGEIDVNTAIRGILKGMEEFKGAAAATSDRTVRGIMGQIGSLIDTYIKLPWGEGLSKGFKEGLGEVRDILDANKEVFKDWGLSLKAVGEDLSTALADKLREILAVVKEITGSDAFKNASLGGKVGMLWDGLIMEPLQSWWEGGGASAIMEKAVDIGKSLGKGIITGFANFLQENPMSALLLGSFVGLKAFGGGSAMAGLGKMAGGMGTAASGTGLFGKAAGWAMAMGAGNLAGGASLGAGALSALGLGGVGGGIVGGVSLFSGAMDLYEGFKEDDAEKKTSGAWKVGGVAGGAAIGAGLGSVIPGLGTLVGGLIGGGLGGLVGMFGGKKHSESIGKAAAETAKLNEQQKKLAKTSLDKHFGKITLSADEMSAAINNALGADRMNAINKTTAAIEAMDESMANLKATDQTLEKSLWIAGLKKGGKLTAAEASNLTTAAQNYGAQAQQFMTDSHYAASQSVSTLMMGMPDADKMLQSTDKYYNDLTAKVTELSGKLNSTVSEALSDGVISLDEQTSIDTIRSQIADITAQIAEDEHTAEMNIIKAKYGAGNLTADQFGEMLAGAQEAAQTAADGYWDAFGKASVGKSEEEIAKLKEGVYKQLGDVWLETGDLGLDTLKEQYSKELGALTGDISEIIANWDTAEIQNSLSNIYKDEEAQAAIGDFVEKLKPTTEQIESVIEAYESLGLAVPEGLTKYMETVDFYEALSGGMEGVQEYFKENPIDVTAKMTPQADTESALALTAEDFGLGAPISGIQPIQLTGNPIYNRVAMPLASDFGVPSSISDELPISITGQAQAANTVSITPSMFGVPSTLFTRVAIQASASVSTSGKFRGGVVGANLPGFAGGGIAKGGTAYRVAEEGDPEVIIPLSSRRRDRALHLWNKTGEMLGVQRGAKGYATGGFVGMNINAGEESDIGGQPQIISAGGGQPSSIEVNVGGITVQVNAEGGQDAVGAIQAQKEQLAEEIAGILNRAIEAQYRNMPSKKGA